MNSKFLNQIKKDFNTNIIEKSNDINNIKNIKHKYFISYENNLFDYIVFAGTDEKNKVLYYCTSSMKDFNKSLNTHNYLTIDFMNRVEKSENINPIDIITLNYSSEDINNYMEFIKNNTLLIKTANSMAHSYKFKHCVERFYNTYISNNILKQLFFMCGIDAYETNNMNWVYCISKKSNIFKF